MHTSTGVLNYGPGIRIIVSIDQGIADYYRSLIPKYYYVQPQKYRAHITVVRTNKETPTKFTAWGKHRDQKIAFQYDPYINCDGKYWFLDATSEQIGDIREELGLPRFRFSDRGCYHISIGNCKDISDD